jgi:hypothetical protein
MEKRAKFIKEYIEKVENFRNAVEDLDGIRNEIREENRELYDIIDQIDRVVRLSNDDLDFSFDEVFEHTIKKCSLVKMIGVDNFNEKAIWDLGNTLLDESRRGDE